MQPVSIKKRDRKRKRHLSNLGGIREGFPKSSTATLNIEEHLGFIQVKRAFQAKLMCKDKTLESLVLQFAKENC